MAWPRSGHALPECERLRNWLSMQDASGSSNGAALVPQELADRLSAHARALAEARRPLLWIESADVSAARATVRLAATCGATIHIAQSPGAQNMAEVTAACGTLGTSLAEVAAHADLIVHLGHAHLRELPLLAARFLTRAAEGDPVGPRRCVLIGDEATESWQGAVHPAERDEVLILPWPREFWLDRLTRVLLAARGDHAPTNRSIDGEDASPTQLAELLAASRYAVFLWDEDEFADELERLVVERLFEIAQYFSQTTRCSLLPLGSDPGRTTAKETLLWLTNLVGPARITDGVWMRPPIGPRSSLEDWQHEHDWILCLRNLPSDRSLPDLQFHTIIDAACNRLQPAAQSAAPRQTTEPLLVAGVGLDGSGHLVRIDHAFAAHMEAAVAPPQPVVTAAQLLDELAAQILAARKH